MPSKLLTREELISTYPEHTNKIFKISDEKLAIINKFLQGTFDVDSSLDDVGPATWIQAESAAIERFGYITIITNSPSHALVTESARNRGTGGRLNGITGKVIHGFACDSIPKFRPGEHYSITLNGGKITLTVGAAKIVFFSGEENLLLEKATGEFF